MIAPFSDEQLGLIYRLTQAYLPDLVECIRLVLPGWAKSSDWRATKPDAVKTLARLLTAQHKPNTVEAKKQELLRLAVLEKALARPGWFDIADTEEKSEENS